jgi:hypothetical protein
MFTLDHYLPIYTQFCISLRLQHRFFPRILKRLCVPHTALDLPYCPYTLKYFPRILGIRRKNKE